MISNRRGVMFVQKDIYESNEKFKDAVIGLKVQIYYISYKPFNNTYKILFTSPYIDEIFESCREKEYTIELSNYGFNFVEIKQ